jgi:hypothetical protein
MFYRSSVMTEVDAINYTIKSPVGVAGLISPWNLPMKKRNFDIWHLQSWARTHAVLVIGLYELLDPTT